MGFADFDQDTFIAFFAVLARLATLVALMPVLGETSIPPTIKILLSLAVTYTAFPVLVSSETVDPRQVSVWGASTSGLVFTVALEVILGLILAFVARTAFDAVSVGSDILGQFMGFSMATQYDPRQEAQTMVIGQFLGALAMLAFLAMDGHHVILRATLESFRVVPVGGAKLHGPLFEYLVDMVGGVLRVGLQLAAPMAVATFVVNVFYGVMAKALPQLNVLVFSLSMSTLLGFFVIVTSFPEFQGVTNAWFEGLGDRLQETLAVTR